MAKNKPLVGLKSFLYRLYRAFFPEKKASFDSEDNHDDFRFIFNHLVKSDENITRMTRVKGRLLDETILGYKRSSTIFILGSGPSINDISAEQWEHIKSCDSVGFNFWMAHPFVPTFYLLQNSNRENYISKRLGSLLQERIDAYRDVPFIMRGSWLKIEDMDLSFLDYFDGDRVYYMNEYAVHSRCPFDPPALLRYFELLGLLERGRIHPTVPKVFATVSVLMNFCYIMGYEKMVLCGIDMKDPGHFWDGDDYREARQKFYLEERADSKIMLLTDRSDKKHTVPDTVYAQEDFYRDRAGVKVEVAGKNTVLYPRLDCYF